MEELKKEMAKRWLKLANYLSDEKLDGKTIFTLSFQDGCNFIIHPEGKNGSTLDLSICIHLQPVEQEKPSESAGKKTFEQILEKYCIENKVYLTSNERHTIYDAVEEYASQKHLPTDCYPKEFVEWMLQNNISHNLRDRRYLSNYALLQLKGFKGDCTLDELFTYWKEIK